MKDRRLLAAVFLGLCGACGKSGANFESAGHAIETAPPAPASATAVRSGIPEPNRSIGVGDPVPDFTLTDQNGTKIRLAQFRGEVLGVTFLYTTCPDVNACPMTMAKFSRLDAMLREKKFGHLLVVTVDPEHDTPSVLRDYAEKAGADAKRWSFLTGAPPEVAEVASRFGVLYSRKGAQVLHQQAVAVVDPEGKLATISYGENWEPEQILKDMDKVRK
jgi:protein SCO1/2